MLLTAYMTGLLTSFRDPFKCHFISKVFSNHTNNEQLSTYPALFFHRIYDHLIYCTYIWMHSNIWMHSSIKMRSYIAGIEKNVWHLINIFWVNEWKFTRVQCFHFLVIIAYWFFLNANNFLYSSLPFPSGFTSLL